jgi:membrane-associated phospholipid phosphatase
MQELQLGKIRAVMFAAIAFLTPILSLSAVTEDALGTTDAKSRPLWNPEWPRVSLPEALIFGTFEGSALLLPLAASPAEVPRWRGGILFDESVRSALLLGQSGQKIASTSSDIGLYILEGAPLLDAGISAWWYRRDRNTAFQLSLMYAEAYSLTSIVQEGLRAAFSRERPIDHFQHCFDNDPSNPPGPKCSTAKNGSFPSNHAAFAFTSAAVTCTQHANIALYGNVNDKLVCAEALTLAAGVSVARVMKDRHWSTDILAGAAVGTLSGWAVPHFLHFRIKPPSSKPGFASGVIIVPMAGPESAGFSLIGEL